MIGSKAIPHWQSPVSTELENTFCTRVSQHFIDMTFLSAHPLEGDRATGTSPQTGVARTIPASGEEWEDQIHGMIGLFHRP
ncbi:unnamed protein product [Caretta caretta]